MLRGAMKRLLGRAWAWWADVPYDPERRELLLAASAVGVMTAIPASMISDEPEAAEPSDAELAEYGRQEVQFARADHVHAPRKSLRENQFYGLGAVIVKPGEEVVLQDRVRCNVWVKELILDAGNGVDDCKQTVELLDVSIAGLSLGPARGLKLQSMQIPRGRFFPAVLQLPEVSDGMRRRLVLEGQSVQVRVRNTGTQSVTVSGVVVVDEVDMPALRTLHEQMLVRAAKRDLDEWG